MDLFPSSYKMRWSNSARKIKLISRNFYQHDLIIYKRIICEKVGLIFGNFFFNTN